MNRVPTGQGKLEKVGKFEWSEKGQVKNFFGKSQGREKKMVPPDVRFSDYKCIKFDFRWGSAHPAGGAYSAPPDPIAALNIAP